MNLNGKWKLYFYKNSSIDITDINQLEKLDVKSIPCTVPGNVELDLSEAGILPADLFKGENILKAEEYENYDWWYETSFTPKKPSENETVILHFGGVDCVADYYINGKKIGSSDNMLIEHDFDVTGILNYDDKNTLHVNIHSPIAEALKYPVDPQTIMNSWNMSNVSKTIRKAPHSYGWDIMPRAVSAGIWRDVELKYESVYKFKYVYFKVQRIFENGGNVSLIFDSDIGLDNSFKSHKFVVSGRCGDSYFNKEFYQKCASGKINFDIENLKLWWPKPYGEPNMYDITIEVYSADGEKLITHKMRQGFRTLSLKHSDIVNDKDGCFEFIVNGQKIMAVGSNWVPMDAYHSRDKQRYKKAFELFDDIGVNIIRCWGGNVYEDNEFFDFCDNHGIMVWQDFAMACHFYPQDDWFLEKIKTEVTAVVERIRSHASVVVWCGDNEIDFMIAGIGTRPSVNRITREVIPKVLERLDPDRPYIMSSPYISDEAFAIGNKAYPEDHLWGPRDYFKSEFYTGSNAYFVSETGYHGCPSRESIEKFIDEEYVWPYFNNKQWNLHSSDQNNRDDRTMLMHNQVRQLFGAVPEDMDEYIIASQISQAEAKKFFIERVRSKMSRMGGIIWWNLLDGWPQMSDAVVDYYYEKKLAYNYIKRSSSPVIIMLGEMKPWGRPVIVANSTLEKASGHVTIIDAETDKTVYDNDYDAKANGNTNIWKVPMMYSDKGMYIIKYTVSGKEFINTYLYGEPGYDLKKYKQWMEKADKMEKAIQKY